jgi:transketolase
VAYGELGATHHSIEDLAWLRPMRGLTVIVPCDPWETAEAVKAAAASDQPTFIRISRMPVPELEHKVPFEIGKAEIMRDGGDVAIIAAGTLVQRALQAVPLLAADGVSARVINMATIAPLDEAAILAAAADCGAIVTAEEHVVRGGLGGAVAEILAQHRPTPMRILGFDGFQPTGSAEWLMERAGLTAEGIATAARQVIAQKRQ